MGSTIAVETEFAPRDILRLAIFDSFSSFFTSRRVYSVYAMCFYNLSEEKDTKTGAHYHSRCNFPRDVHHCTVNRPSSSFSLALVNVAFVTDLGRYPARERFTRAVGDVSSAVRRSSQSAFIGFTGRFRARTTADRTSLSLSLSRIFRARGNTRRFARHPVRLFADVSLPRKHFPLYI